MYLKFGIETALWPNNFETKNFFQNNSVNKQ